MTDHEAPAQTEERPSKRVRLSPSAGNDAALVASSSKLYPPVEVAVGITQYLNPNLPGFSGVLKQRYTDFLVNEIDLEGNVLRLQNMRAPGDDTQTKNQNKKLDRDEGRTKEMGKLETKDAKSEPKPVTEDVKTLAGSTTSNDPASSIEVKDAPVAVTPFQLSEEDSAILVPLLTQPLVDSLVDLYNTILTIERAAKPNLKAATPSTKLTSPNAVNDKDARSSIHQGIRRIFHSKFLTETTKDNRFVIWPARISAPNVSRNGTKNFKDNRNNEDRKPTKKFSELGGEYLHFNLYKENKDTMECISLIARFIKAHPKVFSYAGTKDRRAVTVQRCCAQRIRADRLAGLNPKLKGFKVGDFEYKDNQLSLGDLQGNEFSISLRDCNFGHEGEAVVERAIAGLRDRGFINYYGLQRFGTFSTGTQVVGKYMMQGEWKTAVHKVMHVEYPLPDTASGDERERAYACSKFFENPTSHLAAQEALRLMPRKFVSENSILRWLAVEKNKDNYLGAIQQVPRNLRLIFVHAYQSYIWNSAVSERMRLWGMELHKGDLVIIPAEETIAAKPIIDEDEENIGMDVTDATEETFLRARPLTEQECTSGEFSIYDLVLPTPGWDVVYPDNETKDVYVDLMAKDNLDPYDMRRQQKETSLAGHYRKVVHKPEHVSYEIKRYAGAQDQLVETDLEWATQKAKKARANGKEETAKANEGGERTAVIIKLRLGTSQYATMALREVLKGGTESYVAVFNDDEREKNGDGRDVEMKG